MQAIVNTPGDYNITTDTVDGVSFSAIGHFSTTGSTPLATGDFTFTPSIVGPAPIGGGACDATVTVQ